MNVSIKEINELIYSLGTTAIKGMFCNKELNASLLDKLYNELNRKIAEDEGPEYDGAGFSHSDNFRSHFVTNEEADEDARTNSIELPVEFGTKEFNDMCASYFGGQSPKREPGLITQLILDYVDEKGAVSYSEMNEYYKLITGGSNSFSHILANLRIPYKNRKTQRYVAKEGRRYTDALYVIKVANPSNWVVAEK